MVVIVRDEHEGRCYDGSKGGFGFWMMVVGLLDKTDIIMRIVYC